nr:MAG TPA: hypothetical protein [Caudoviricetes sp.]
MSPCFHYLPRRNYLFSLEFPQIVLHIFCSQSKIAFILTSLIDKG